MDNTVGRMLDDQRNIVELELSIKKLKFQRKKKSCDDLLDDQRNIVELELSIKKLKFQRKKKVYVKVLE